jgi:hypothetical protein
MDEENINPDEVVQEEETTDESQDKQEENLENSDDKVVLSKSDYNKLNRKAIAYETVKKSPKVEASVAPVDSIELVKLGKKLRDYSDEEIDFAMDVAKSKDPKEIMRALENPFVVAGIGSMREKLEKEKLSVKPTGTQPETDLPKSLAEKLAEARTLQDKQKVLEEHGLYSEPGYRPDRVVIRP